MAKYEKKTVYDEVPVGQPQVGNSVKNPFYQQPTATKARVVKTKLDQPPKKPLNLKKWLGIPAVVATGALIGYGLSQIGGDEPLKEPGLTQKAEANPVFKFAPGTIKVTESQDMAVRAIMADGPLASKIGYFFDEKLKKT